MNYKKNNICKIKEEIYKNEFIDKLENYRYKNKMKTNDNMSTGIFKNTLIYILLEDDAKKRNNMMEKFNEAIMNILFI